MYNEEFYHHGIKGMKWGRRRFQNADGSLTLAGKKRYAADEQVAKTKAAYKSAKKDSYKAYNEWNNASSKDFSAKKQEYKNARGAQIDAKYAYKNAKQARKEAVNGPKEKSNHRQKLEAKYLEQGMNQQQAEAAANKRIRAEKTIAVVGGMTVAAATAYVVNKNIKERSDYIIKSGSKMQRMTRTPDESLDRAFYASYKKGDNQTYRGLMGKGHFGGVDVHKVTLSANSDVKVASRKKSAEAFMDLYKNDPEFKKAFIDSTSEMYMKNKFGIGPNMTDKMLKSKGYDAMNSSLVNRSESGSIVSKKFYDKMKSLGYDAVQDVNDQKYSGYNAKRPVIVFNNNGKLTKSDVRKMGSEELGKEYSKTLGRMILREYGKKGALYGGIAAGATYASRTMKSMAIDDYKVKHPNSKLTDAEIEKLLYNN